MHKVFEQWHKDFIPVTIKTSTTGKKDAFPMPWKNGEVYTKFDKNSIGMRTGATTANVLDVDTKDLSLLKEPIKSWVDDRLMFEDTLIVSTANGYHFYFEADFKVKTTTKTTDYVDFRGEGGLIFIHSTSDIASYEVICDTKPTNDIAEIKDVIPVYSEQPISTDIGFENLEDIDDTEVTTVSSINKKPLEEVLELVDKTSSNCSRDEWMKIIASAYNLIDKKPERLKEPLKEWSKKGATKQHPYEEKAFEAVWKQLTTREYGTSFEGGTLILIANTSSASKLEEDIKNAGTVKELNKIIEKVSKIKSLRTVDNSDEEVRTKLSTEINLQFKELKKSNSKVKPKQARTIVKELQYKPTIKELEESGEAKDIDVYFIGSKYLIRIGDKVSTELGYASALVYCRLQGINEQIATAYLEKASVISKCNVRANYNISKNVVYKLDKAIAAHVHDILTVNTNPIFSLRRQVTDKYDEVIIKDFFDDIWQGKALDIIKLIALTIRFKEEKKNQLMLVTPTSFGKTKMMKHLGFGEIGMETLLGAFQGDGIGSEVLTPIQSSGLMLINEVDNTLPKRLKELENNMQVKEFGSSGGTRNVALHFVIFTSTHETAVLKATDEVGERTMFMQLDGEDSKYNLTSSDIFRADRALYTEVIRNEMINQFIYYLYDAEVDKNYLLELQEAYKLHPSEDLQAISQDIYKDVIRAIKHQGYGKLNNKNEWVVQRKRDVRALIEAKLEGYGDIDIGKQVSSITSKLYTGDKRKVEGVTYYVVNTDTPIESMFDDLEEDEEDEF